LIECLSSVVGGFGRMVMGVKQYVLIHWRKIR
jgi:hypothetical protein